MSPQSSSQMAAFFPACSSLCPAACASTTPVFGPRFLASVTPEVSAYTAASTWHFFSGFHKLLDRYSNRQTLLRMVFSCCRCCFSSLELINLAAFKDDEHFSWGCAAERAAQSAENSSFFPNWFIWCLLPTTTEWEFGLAGCWGRSSDECDELPLAAWTVVVTAASLMRSHAVLGSLMFSGLKDGDLSGSSPQNKCVLSADTWRGEPVIHVEVRVFLSPQESQTKMDWKQVLAQKRDISHSMYEWQGWYCPLCIYTVVLIQKLQCE